MNRRNFLINASLAIAGLAIDPEELFWTPRRDRIFVPSSKLVIYDWPMYMSNRYLFTANKAYKLLNGGWVEITDTTSGRFKFDLTRLNIIDIE